MSAEEYEMIRQVAQMETDMYDNSSASSSSAAPNVPIATASALVTDSHATMAVKRPSATNFHHVTGDEVEQALTEACEALDELGLREGMMYACGSSYWTDGSTKSVPALNRQKDSKLAVKKVNELNVAFARAAQQSTGKLSTYGCTLVRVLWWNETTAEYLFTFRSVSRSPQRKVEFPKPEVRHRDTPLIDLHRDLSYVKGSLGVCCRSTRELVVYLPGGRTISIVAKSYVLAASVLRDYWHYVRSKENEKLTDGEVARASLE